jgi:hypothetical protein
LIQARGGGPAWLQNDAPAIIAAMSPSDHVTYAPIGETIRMFDIVGTISIYYFLIKIVFFYSLVRAQVKYDLIKDHYLFLGILYTVAVAFLSFCFFWGFEGENFPDRPLEWKVSQLLGTTKWRAWLVETLVLSTVYFKLMAKFDEGVLFWTLLLLGIGVAIF